MKTKLIEAKMRRNRNKV